MSDNRPIGIFDSGVGGLTVLKELKSQMPNERYIYLGDTLNFPYGEKSKEQIIEYSRNNIKILQKENVKMIIIACGTATSQALETVKKEFDIPIIGIIEPTVEYISTLNIKKVGVIATTGTIRSGAWEKNIKQKMPNIEVINKACPVLASMVEEGKAKSKESLNAVHEYMKIFKENDVKDIILGCTHYPIYNEIIQNEFDYKINLINTGVYVAKKIKQNKNLLSNEKFEQNEKIILTKNVVGFEKKRENILKNKMKIV